MSPTGPWLLLRRDEDRSLLNLDGTGRTNLAGWAYPSADGRLAFVESGELVLYQLPVATSQRRIPLFPAAPRQPDDPRDPRLDKCDDFFKIDFSPYVYWSPEGSRLAVTAAIDGPTIDLYAYDFERDEIRRLSSGAGRAKLEPSFDPWSPDGRWIVHLELGLDSCSFDAVWVAAADGSGSRLVPDSKGMEPVAWMGPSKLLLSASLYRFETIFLESYDFITGERRRLLDGEWDSIGVDPGSGTVLFSPCIGAPAGMGYCEGEAAGLDNGLYVIPGGSEEIRRVETGVDRSHWPLIWHPQLNRFTASVGGESTKATFLVGLDGQVLARMAPRCGPEPSPDGAWMVFSCTLQDRMALFSGGGEFVAELGPPGTRDFAWHPDSTAIYFVGKTQPRAYGDQPLDPFVVGRVTVPDGDVTPLARLPDLEAVELTELAIIE